MIITLRTGMDDRLSPSLNFTYIILFMYRLSRSISLNRLQWLAMSVNIFFVECLLGVSAKSRLDKLSDLMWIVKREIAVVQDCDFAYYV